MNVRRFIKEICRGCMLSSRLGLCFFVEYNIEYKCPCSECLVKVMCRDSCDERIKTKHELGTSH